MALPQLPPRDRPDAWKRGLYMEPAERESLYFLTGFADYHLDHEGRLWHLSHPDASGHRRRGREVKRQRKPAGSEGYGLRRNGCPVWVSASELERLKVPA